VQASHVWRADSAVFDEGNLVSHAGLVPLLELAEQTGLSQLLDEHVRFVCERVKSAAANSTRKLTAVIAGMAAGADSIDDLDVIRSGGMGRSSGCTRQRRWESCCGSSLSVMPGSCRRCCAGI
jgi:hypothetical protein